MALPNNIQIGGRYKFSDMLVKKNKKTKNKYKKKKKNKYKNKKKKKTIQKKNIKKITKKKKIIKKDH